MRVARARVKRTAGVGFKTSFVQNAGSIAMVFVLCLVVEVWKSIIRFIKFLFVEYYVGNSGFIARVDSWYVDYSIHLGRFIINLRFGITDYFIWAYEFYENLFLNLENRFYVN